MARAETSGRANHSNAACISAHMSRFMAFDLSGRFKRTSITSGATSRTSSVLNTGGATAAGVPTTLDSRAHADVDKCARLLSKQARADTGR
ncbi:hypothetical protein EON67_05125 [archaeon]|nr:MAG: hypothetical protein EON67_05125 [archaeon]